MENNYSAENRNNNFGTLHLIAAFFVLYGHQCALINSSIPILLGNQIQVFGVKIIFLISGYLIIKSLFQEESKHVCAVYAAKRLGRLYPELLFCLLCTALIIAPIVTSFSLSDYFTNREVVRYILGNLGFYPIYNLPGVFQKNPYVGAVNGSLWTIPVEAFSYIILLFLYILTKRLNKRKTAVGLIIACCMIFLIRIFSFSNAKLVVYGTDWIEALNIIPYMLIGGGVYLLQGIRKYLNIQVAVILFIIGTSITFNIQGLNELVCIIVLPYLIFSLTLCEKQYLQMRYLRSEYAYGVYLWGFVVQQCIVQKFYVELGNIDTVNKLFFVSVIITYILAALSYHWVYVPISKYNRKLISYIRQKN